MTGKRLLWVLVLAGLGGCTEPRIIDSAEPGVDPRGEAAVKDETPAEALGEAALTETKSKQQVKSNIPLATPTAKGETKTTASGVKYETVKEGTGPVAQPGQIVTVHYVGTLENGNKFDSSRDRKAPANFSIGTGAVILGWDEAVPGMKVGEVRKLVVPPSAGYGALGSKGAVPPNATLNFEIELLGVK